MTKQKPVEEASLLEIAVSRVGFRRAVTVLTLLLTWGAYMEAGVDAEPSIMGYVRWSGAGERVVRRKLAMFREAFPDQANPSALWLKVRGRISDDEREVVRVAQVGALRVGGVS